MKNARMTSKVIIPNGINCNKQYNINNIKVAHDTDIVYLIMTFTVSSKTLYEVFTTLSKVIAPKNTLHILDDFIMRLENETLFVTAADTENIMTASVAVTGEDDNGCFAISATNIMDGLKNMPDMMLTFNHEKNMLKVSYQNGHFTMTTENPDEFPLPHDFVPNINISMQENILQENIARSIFATANDDLRPTINGIYFNLKEDALDIVATNGHQLVRNRLFSIQATDNNKGGFIMPKKVVMILKNTLRKENTSVNIISDFTWMTVSTENFTLHSRLVEGRYPNYNSVIPQNNNNTLTVDRNNLIAVLKRITPFSDGNSQLIKVNIQTNKLIVQAENFELSKTGTESMNADYDGMEMNIGFKSSALLGVLENINSTDVKMLLSDQTRAGLILPAVQPENQEVLMLLMPMLIND